MEHRGEVGRREKSGVVSVEMMWAWMKLSRKKRRGLRLGLRLEEIKSEPAKDTEREWPAW